MRLDIGKSSRSLEIRSRDRAFAFLGGWVGTDWVRRERRQSSGSPSS